MSRNICLVGMMGAGKSTVAELVGARLGRLVADTDDEIRGWSGRSIPEIFAEHGEPGFRELERQVVEELPTFHDLVIALAGGAVLRDDQRRAAARRRCACDSRNQVWTSGRPCGRRARRWRRP